MSLFGSSGQLDTNQRRLALLVSGVTTKRLNISESSVLYHQMTCLVFCESYIFKGGELEIDVDIVNTWHVQCSQVMTIQKMHTIVCDLCIQNQSENVTWPFLQFISGILFENKDHASLVLGN